MGRDWVCDDPKKQLIWAAATKDALRLLEGKWKIVIICQLFGAKAPIRFAELERRIEGVTQKMLIQQLKQLVKDGIIARKVYPQVPPRVEYSLTEMGKALGPSMAELTDWAMKLREAATPPQEDETEGDASIRQISDKGMSHEPARID